MESETKQLLLRAAAAVFAFVIAAPGVRAAGLEQRRADLRDLVGRPIDARVVRVADGDTLEAVPAGESRPVRVRLEGVDAPEQGEVFSREALGLLRTLVFDRVVRLRGRDVDRYGRLVARVISGGADASAALVRAGLACHAYAFDAELAREEAGARAAGAGFWAASVRKPRCVTRTAFSARSKNGTGVPRASERARELGGTLPPPPEATELHGNVRSRVYHAPACRNYNCPSCTRVFASEAAARAAGYRPAGDCLGQ